MIIISIRRSRLYISSTAGHSFSTLSLYHLALTNKLTVWLHGIEGRRNISALYDVRLVLLTKDKTVKKNQLKNNFNLIAIVPVLSNIIQVTSNFY